MLDRWETEWKKSDEAEQISQSKHEERAINGQNNNQIRAGKFGPVAP